MAKNILFVCRGNAFRSIIAEAYLKSKHLPGIEVSSAGTVAAARYAHNVSVLDDINDVLVRHDIDTFRKERWGEQLTQEMLDKADLVILLNDIVRAETEQIGLKLPPTTQIWDIVDMGEPGRIAENREQELLFREGAYQDIRVRVDALVDTFRHINER